MLQYASVEDEYWNDQKKKKKDNVERVEEERDQVCWFERNMKSLKLDYSGFSYMDKVSSLMMTDLGM